MFVPSLFLLLILLLWLLELDDFTINILFSLESELPLVHENHFQPLGIDVTFMEREILTLRDLMELSYREIGEIIGISEAAATERHRRTIAKCRKLEQGKELSDFI